MIARHDTTLFFMCRLTTLQHTGACASITFACATELTQAEFRQPMRVSVSIRSGLSRAYAMAGTFRTWIETARVGARGIRPAVQAGLAISI